MECILKVLEVIVFSLLGVCTILTVIALLIA